MITDRDVSKLKKEFSKDFATKSFVRDELKAMEKRQDAKYAKQKDMVFIKKELQKMNKSLKITIGYFDKVTTNHESRIKTVEKTLNIVPPAN
ncbi:hypothetical protein ACFL1A_02065 [Patescibacteria group bacterium]